MSSSSGDGRPQLDVGEIEQAEEILEQRPPKAEAAQGVAARRQSGRRGMTALWAAPGLLWLGFYLIAPLVFIVLVSFWTYQVGASSGFVTDWTFSNYSELFHDSVYWQNMRSSFFRSLIAVVACLVFGFPVAYFLALKVQQPAEPDCALHPRARAVLDELPDALGRLDVSADGPRGRAQPGARQARHSGRALRAARLLGALGDAGHDPALHPLHGHAALLHALAGRPHGARGRARPGRQLAPDLPRGDPARRRCPAS